MVGRAVDLALTGGKVSVNITGQTIGDPAVMGEILRTLAEAGPDATDKISFGITRTVALASLELAKSFSQSVHDLGCRVTGRLRHRVQGLHQLRNLNLDALKIDQSFVRDMLEDRDDERVVKTIVFVAQEYSLATVAEGGVGGSAGTADGGGRRSRAKDSSSTYLNRSVVATIGPKVASVSHRGLGNRGRYRVGVREDQRHP